MDTDIVAINDILVAGPDFATCSRKVLNFFAKTGLVKYDVVTVVEAESLPATDPAFWERLGEGEAINRQRLATLIDELEQEGIRTLADLKELRQGYASKLLHTAIHLLDGFIGIDTRLYSIDDDMHWCPDCTREQIRRHPANYWLLRVRCTTDETACEDRYRCLRRTGGG